MIKKNHILYYILFYLSLTPLNKSIAQQYHSPLDFKLLLSGTFGELRGNHFHTGIDIKTEGVEGQKVYSINEGYVSRIKVSSFGYGKAIYINHPDGTTSVYAHLKRFNNKIDSYVKREQYNKERFEIELFPEKEELKIKSGEMIAFSGNSGGSFGAHLHFEVRETATQKPINPLNLGFHIKDNISPIIKEIKIYDMKNEKNTNVYNCIKTDANYTINEKPIVSKEIGFGISTYDKLDGAYNKNGVYSIELFVNQKLIYHFQADKLNFNTNRYINAHIDYYEKRENSKKFHRCYKLPNNKLENYKSLQHNGLLKLQNDSSYNISLLVKDFAGNKSYLTFTIKCKIDKNHQEQKKNKKKPHFHYNTTNSFSNKDFQLKMKENSLYDNIIFEYLEKDSIEGVYGKVHQCHFDYEPIHKKYNIKIKSNLSEELKEYAYIAKKDKNKKFWYMGGNWQNDILEADVREFGDFCIVADTNPPIITGINMFPGKNITTQKTIKLTIEDKESGIKSYRGEIDGNWILMEYDYKRKLLTYNMSDGLIKKGEHKLTLKVSDKVGNQKLYIANFTL